MSRCRDLSILFLIFAFAAPSRAYEVRTHGLWTFYSFSASILADPSFQTALGIDLYTFPAVGTRSPQPFGDIYLDMGDTIRTRTGKRFERDRMPDSDALGFHQGEDSLSLAGWLMRGAIREDDVPWTDPRSNDDPVNAIRPLNHFFDPANNSPLTIGGVTGGTQAGAKNPDWALGTTDAFTNPDQANDLRKNHFSVFDAREAMWRALTLTDKNNASVDSVDGLSKQQVRMAYWATTFRALGDLLHMIQDMAQPQHARNEPHNGLGTASIQQNVTGHGSITENYIDARATGEPVFEVGGSGAGRILINPAPLTFTGYSGTPSFARYADFFSTSPGSSTSPGYGMADHANRRFFSEAKNLGSSDLSLPSNDPTAYATCPVAATNWDGSSLPDGVQVKLLCSTQSNPYQDELTGQTSAGILMTADSAWNIFVPNTPRYHLAKENFDQQAALLIPRGTAYSAGLINFFFRGQMQIAPPADGVYAYVDHSRFSGDSVSATDLNGFAGFNKIRVMLNNSTDSVTPPGPNAQPIPQSMGAGKLVAVVKFHRNTCYTDDLASETVTANKTLDDCRSPTEEIVTSNTVTVQGVDTAPTQYEFPFFSGNEIPINAMDVYLQVVFRGVLGQEADAVVVATKDVSEPTYVVVSNSQDYVWIGGGMHTRDEVNNSASLRGAVQPSDCVVNDQLRSDCFALKPLDLSLTLTTAKGQTQIGMTGLPVDKYVRVAYLLDAVDFPHFAIQGCRYDGPNNLTGTIQELLVFSSGNLVKDLDKLGTSRQVNSWLTLDCVYYGDGTTPPSDAITGKPGLAAHPIAVSNVTPAWN